MSNPLKILVVDDSKVSRALIIALIMTRQPHAVVIEAGDGQAAVETARQEPPDLAILDINMPVMSGLEAAEQIRRLAPQTRLALLTANAQDAMRQKAQALNVPLFKKPAKGEVIDQILALLEAP
ncbi:CheY-like chemotaxis protein [Paucibacter oligotrophus]|uniref:CheY-like chemotaxis protein n=1 Tax=Roseateles oligotrophus TaxID=1769250 RepID=A0A840LC58_9BURK|nr:response regulator transcription factor [Roseateles oligotrophus]MBB4843669.1 CheY-like chemotaxis protein [Roseateles oligotrophus]